jgi:hypothetical protein
VVRPEVVRGAAQRLVERGRWSGDLAAGHPPGLLEAVHGDALAGQRQGQGGQVVGVDAGSGAVADQERGDRVPGA